MSEQQLLPLILGLVIVAVAIGVGMTQFGASNTEGNKDAITTSLTNLSANAYQYRIRPSTLGGGGGQYTGYSIPRQMVTNDDGTFAVSVANANMCVFTGTSSLNAGWVATCTTDDSGKTILSYSGW